MSIPIVTIDGPSGTGKGTVAKKLALDKGWHYLDSGAVYRAFASLVDFTGVDSNDDEALAQQLKVFDLEFSFSSEGYYRVFCLGRDITQDIRHEKIGLLASILSSKPMIRKALLEYQLSFYKAPGLVTDGRDMGTVVFPKAQYKFYLTAGVKERANRRYKQLQEQGINGNLRTIEADLEERDRRDSGRSISPMKPAQDALVIDTTHLSIDQVFQLIVDEIDSV